MTVTKIPLTDIQKKYLTDILRILQNKSATLMYLPIHDTKTFYNKNHIMQAIQDILELNRYCEEDAPWLNALQFHYKTHPR